LEKTAAAQPNLCCLMMHFAGEEILHDIEIGIQMSRETNNIKK
jgi:hypothetical protein